MGYESLISYKYLTLTKDRFISVINLISIAGIAIGVMALIVVIGVMAGFDHDLREKIVGTNAHIVIEKENGIRNSEEIQEKIKGINSIVGVSPYIHGNVFLEYHSQAMSLILRGINPATEQTVTKVKDYLVKGDILNLKDDEVVIGSELARYFGYGVGDQVTLIAPGSGLSGQGWRHTLKIVGIFTSGMYDYDMNLIFTTIPRAQMIFNLSDGIVSGISLKLNNIYAAEQVKKEIHGLIGFSYIVRTWVDSNRNFFAALKLEKFAMFVILTLIVLVAAFNIISTLIVTVTSKVKDIGILKAIGVPSAAIRRIFTFQGLYLGCVGTFWGVVGGIFLCLILKKYQFVKLPQEIYYIDKMPVLIQLSDILIIVGSAILISFLATLYPAAKAARLEPVEALRYE